MSAKLIGEVFENAPDTVTFDEMLILVALADYPSKHFRHAYPKVETLAAKVHCSPRKVQELIHSLIMKGLLIVYDAPNKASFYMLQKLDAPVDWPESYRDQQSGRIFARRHVKPNVKKKGALTKVAPAMAASAAPPARAKRPPIRPGVQRKTKFYSLPIREIER